MWRVTDEGKIAHSVPSRKDTIARGSIERIADKAPKGSLFTFTDLSPSAKGTSFEHENAIYVGKRNGERQFIAFGIWSDDRNRPLFVSEREIKTLLARSAIEKTVRDADESLGRPHSIERTEEAVKESLATHMFIDVRIDAVTAFRR